MTSARPELPAEARRRAASIAVLFAAWIAATAALVEPLQAAILNWDELAVDFPTLLLRLSPAGITIWMIAATLAAAACAASPLRGTAMLVGLCIATWLQGDVFIVEYGTFDGTPLDWEAHRGIAWLEGLAWLGLPALAAYRPRFWADNALRILVLLVLIQAAGVAGIAADHSPFAPRPARAADRASNASSLATLSTQGNAIVVVLDAAQSDFFAEAMLSEVLAEEMPEGFVYYRNAVSLYESTQFSLQSMLTSRAVPNGKGALGWRIRAMRGSLPIVLADVGFDARLVSFLPQALACRELVGKLNCTLLSSVAKLSPAEAHEFSWRTDVNLLFRLGIFRLTPHVLKPRIYDAGEWGIRGLYAIEAGGDDSNAATPETRTDLAALAQLTRRVRVEDVEPRFRFLHLNGAHPPALTRADCNGRVEGDLRHGAVETTRCVLSRLFRFLAALDAAGGYDPSVIAIVADHGFPVGEIDTSFATPPLPAPGSSAATVPFPARGVPLFLVKRPGERGALRVSDRPVSLCDIPTSVLEALYVDTRAPFGCESIFSPERKMPRLHYRYPGYDVQKSIPRLNSFPFQFEPVRVDGHSWYKNSWRRVHVGASLSWPARAAYRAD